MILSVNRISSPANIEGRGALPTAPGSGTNVSTKSFHEVLKTVKGGGDLHQELLQFEKQIAQGATFTPHELLYIQIRAGQYGLKVELISRLAESVNQAMKKLQNQG